MNLPFADNRESGDTHQPRRALAGKEQNHNARGAPKTGSHRVSPRLMSISATQNLSTLQRLRILSIQSNRITKLEGLDSLISLEELYISHNGLTKIEGLEHNVRRASHKYIYFLTYVDGH
jgi:Leucine Rich repeats (2 copies)